MRLKRWAEVNEVEEDVRSDQDRDNLRCEILFEMGTVTRLDGDWMGQAMSLDG